MYCRWLIVNILLLYIILAITKRYRTSLFEKRTTTEVTKLSKVIRDRKEKKNYNVKDRTLESKAASLLLDR